MTAERTIILVRTNSPGADESEWNNWYETQHIAARLAIPGFLCIRRFKLSNGLPTDFAIPGPQYLALYEVETQDVLSSKPYLALVQHEASLPNDSFEARTRAQPDISRGIFRQIFPDSDSYSIPADSDYLLAVGHADLPAQVLDEYHAWYNTEHIPSYLQIPGVLNARRFMIQPTPSGEPSKLGPYAPDYAALYDLTSDDLFDSDAFRQRSSTPWSTRVRNWTWERRKMNNSYQCIYRSDT